jgi:hypothetical protein
MANDNGRIMLRGDRPDPGASVRLDDHRRRVARCLACGWSAADDGTDTFPASVAGHLRGHRDKLQLPGFESPWDAS